MGVGLGRTVRLKRYLAKSLMLKGVRHREGGERDRGTGSASKKQRRAGNGTSCRAYVLRSPTTQFLLLVLDIRGSGKN